MAFKNLSQEILLISSVATTKVTEFWRCNAVYLYSPLRPRDDIHMLHLQSVRAQQLLQIKVKVDKNNKTPTESE
jgi:hypothetical protein